MSGAEARPSRDAQPAILTVDDDPQVSRSVARDLRRRYGDTYRVVRAESGSDALEALSELTLRGVPVALLVEAKPKGVVMRFMEPALSTLSECWAGIAL